MRHFREQKYVPVIERDRESSVYAFLSLKGEKKTNWDIHLIKLSCVTRTRNNFLFVTVQHYYYYCYCK